MRNAAALFALILQVSASATASSVASVTDDRGHVSRFAAVPERIVTLLPSLTESVCSLGACARLVGTDRYSNWPEAVVRLPKLGALEDALVEQIAALHPDVVLAAISSRVIDRLDELGIPVIAFHIDTLNDTQHVLHVVARLLGAPGAGDALWRRVEARIAAAATRVPPDLRGARVYFEVSEAPYAASESSFIGELLARLGLRNVVPGALGPFPKLNPEFVVRAQPDVVMAEQRELEGMASRPGWTSIRALANGRRCGFASARSDVLVRSGPRLGEGADLIVDCLVSVAVAQRRQ